MTEHTLNTADKDWWRGAVIYQVYPRSFQDSDGDGVGDIRGIADRLDYIAGLGADAVWISPFFTSPMKDFGYDVSNYKDIDPMFGTLADFDAMIEKAHALGLKIMIDLVLSHTSDQHPWFMESRASRDNPKADWYVWAEAKPDGSPPNNWLSIFGGSAWQWDSRRLQYYMHNFLVSQPDLNFHNPDVQDALLDAARFWLERGVDGFRLDTINFYFCDRELRDNPALAPERRNDSTAPAVNPYNYQEHLYDKSRPENLAFLKRLRALMEEYPAIAAVGEVGDSQRGLEIVGEYTSGDDKMQMCYAFEFLAPQQVTPKRVIDSINAFDAAAPEGWACWAFSNHDVVRHLTRWGADVADQTAYAKMLGALLMTLKGSICLYEGEELGLTEADIAFEDLQDPYGIEFWPEFKGRDGCRTPMAWQAGAANAGFSTAEKTWLPVSADHVMKAVDVQAGNPSSVLEHYRRFLAFRKAHPALAKGAIRFLSSGDDAVLVFTREGAGETVLCVFNMSAEPAKVRLPEGAWTAFSTGDHGFSAEEDGTMVQLPAWGGYFARQSA
ncbi:alpha-glucosidase family protein [Martelella sp. AD-3]|uniref:beta-galactosidase BglA n=1 Tax=Martelella sp. AD-3 TaxID=686597 RepID=UPI00046685F4|nr:alpha-glucosidase family protein [Martelella sp. AD-3]AMM85519.1 alpha-glucosidase [Martelella sp. AD-3]MAM13814.1 alpha-glucosidase [Rhizobiaceae bacterium]